MSIDAALGFDKLGLPYYMPGWQQPSAVLDFLMRKDKWEALPTPLRVQIETARQLLVDTDLPIAAIATLTGFSESKYFIAVFDRHVGTTPRSFRVKNGRFNGLSD